MIVTLQQPAAGWARINWGHQASDWTHTCCLKGKAFIQHAGRCDRQMLVIYGSLMALLPNVSSVHLDGFTGLLVKLIRITYMKEVSERSMWAVEDTVSLNINRFRDIRWIPVLVSILALLSGSPRHDQSFWKKYLSDCCYTIQCFHLYSVALGRQLKYRTPQQSLVHNIALFFPEVIILSPELHSLFPVLLCSFIAVTKCHYINL